jgi:hypothetical protein
MEYVVVIFIGSTYANMYINRELRQQNEKEKEKKEENEVKAMLLSSSSEESGEASEGLE